MGSGEDGYDSTSGVESRLGVESSILDLWCSAVAMHLHVRVLRLRLCVENVWRILGYQYELYVQHKVFEIRGVENSELLTYEGFK